MKKVIITRANGFVGTAVCKKLADKGIEVIATPAINTLYCSAKVAVDHMARTIAGSHGVEDIFAVISTLGITEENSQRTLKNDIYKFGGIVFHLDESFTWMSMKNVIRGLTFNFLIIRQNWYQLSSASFGME